MGRTVFLGTARSEKGGWLRAANWVVSRHCLTRFPFLTTNGRFWGFGGRAGLQPRQNRGSWFCSSPDLRRLQQQAVQVAGLVNNRDGAIPAGLKPRPWSFYILPSKSQVRLDAQPRVAVRRGPKVRALECGGLTPPWNRPRAAIAGGRLLPNKRPKPGAATPGWLQGGVEPPHSKAGCARKCTNSGLSPALPSPW